MIKTLPDGCCGYTDKDGGCCSPPMSEQNAGNGELNPGEYVLVPKSAIDWLFGEGPDQNGSHFGDDIPARAPPYWWRSHFRKLINGEAVSAQKRCWAALLASAPTAPGREEATDLVKRLREKANDIDSSGGDWNARLFGEAADALSPSSAHPAQGLVKALNKLYVEAPADYNRYADGYRDALDAVRAALSAQGKDDGVLDAFLNLIADGDFEEDVDADADDYGRLIDCTRYHIRSIPVSTFNDFCDAIGVMPKHEETYGDALIRLIADEPSTPSREG